MAEFTGHTFGEQYELQEQLDDNGIIVTYRAIQTSLDREVAIHLVNYQNRVDPDWPAAMVSGAQIAAKYAHPNITPVYDQGIYQSVHYVVLRLMEGGSLNTRLREGPLDLLHTAATVSQIAAALDYVHAQGNYHGDPSTMNIVYDSSGNAYIADFYLLGHLQNNDPNRVTGTRAFMAPERFTGDRPPSAETDQFAVASITYYMLTGKLPWSSYDFKRDPHDLVAPQTLRPEIPESVNIVLARALSIEAQDRYPTIVAFSRQLDQALHDTPQHIFISYSQRDSDYAQRLSDYLTSNGLQVWFDTKIEKGDQWFNQISDAIQNSAGVIVVMSPDSETSEWVHKEILLAKRFQKPIFPVLLRGEGLPILIDLQYESVTDGVLPGPEFHRRLTNVIYGV